MKVYMTMAGVLFNAFTSNYIKEMNRQIHAKRKKNSSGLRSLVVVKPRMGSIASTRESQLGREPLGV
ncbi:hypothetical protein E2C01_043158 [Portunus trituberculatus]|uniref:Uncharacterized protein n=1 Tax=Portunus trituberculatus TaxID=210409 RepID=A0A5B7FVJ8_PORTR|nr:hypothetical protein [Portunus trituberculatus]